MLVIVGLVDSNAMILDILHKLIALNMVLLSIILGDYLVTVKRTVLEVIKRLTTGIVICLVVIKSSEGIFKVAVTVF
ncbi:unnamed protein product [Adineta steineri]|uniref:Uncharacterized protein n=1 Tax=Adineta steineri TaxID=433720 RepID=A0A815AL93_9BILA|nr:unnamed protein product [Adineta steineri]